MYIDGSNRTKKKPDIDKIEKDKLALSYKVLKYYFLNFERWLYHLDSKLNQSSKRTEHSETHILYPDKDCILYIRKPKDFSLKLRKLVRNFTPYTPGLFDSFEVELWDEEDDYKTMIVTSIENTDDDFIVFYISSDGEPMSVKGNDLGDDEVINLIEKLIETTNNHQLFPKFD